MQGCSSRGGRGEEAEEVEEVEEAEDEGSREVHRERWALRAVFSIPCLKSTFVFDGCILTGILATCTYVVGFNGSSPKDQTCRSLFICVVRSACFGLAG